MAFSLSTGQKVSCIKTSRLITNPPLQDSPPPQEELQNRFYSIRGQSSETETWEHAAAEADLSLYAGDVNFQYVDFAKRQDESATFRIQDFTWDEEGYSTIARSAVKLYICQ